MRRAAVAAVLVLALALPAQAATRRASLKLQSTAPLVVLGRGFGPREPVLATYLARGTTPKVAQVRAGPGGSFRAVFAFRVPRCSSFTVRAAGAQGSRAILQVERDCPKRKGPPPPTSGSG